MRVNISKVMKMIQYEDPENISGLALPITAEQLDSVEEIHFVPILQRTDDYDLRRVKYFVNHPEEINNLELEFDDVVLVVNDGNHRLMAALYLGMTSIDAELYGCVDYAYLIEENTNA